MVRTCPGRPEVPNRPSCVTMIWRSPAGQHPTVVLEVSLCLSMPLWLSHSISDYFVIQHMEHFTK